MPKRKPEQEVSTSKHNAEDPVTFTSRHPTWAYLELELVSDNPPTSTSSTSATIPHPPLDALTARTYLTSALSQFLGVSGTSIPIDILKVGNATTSKSSRNKNQDVIWLRTPHDDLSAMTGAISSWVGSGVPGPSGVVPSVAFRVRRRGSWLGGMVGGGGGELFEP